MKPARFALAAVALLALGAALPRPAAAITRKQATKVALKALKPATVKSRVVVFGLPRPLAKGARVVEAAPKAGKGKPLAGRTWLFWADWVYDAQFEHPSTLVLVSDRTGKVIRRQGMGWYPLVNGKRPAFLASREAYQSGRYQVYQGLPRTRATSSVARVRALASPRVAPNLKDDCLLVIGDHEDPMFTPDFKLVKQWADKVGLKQNDVSTAEGLDLRIGVLSTPELTNPPCKDAMIVLIGHGSPKDPIRIPGTGQGVLTSAVPEVEVGHKVVDGKKTSDHEKVTGPDLARIVSKYKGKVTFKMIVQSCFSGRFAQWLGYASIFPNIKVIATSSSATEFSWARMNPRYRALPGSPGNSSFFSGVQSTTSNPLGASEFMNGLFGGLDQVLSSPADMALTGGDLAKMIARGFQLESKGDFTAQLAWTTPQIYANPEAKVVALPRYRFEDIGTAPGGKHSIAVGISRTGIVTGTSTPPSGKRLVFRFRGATPGKPKELSSIGTPAGSAGADGVGVNTSGQVAGTTQAESGPASTPFLWRDGIFTPLGTLGGTSGFASGVNDAGQVVGVSDLPSGVHHPFRWLSGTMTDLGTLGGSQGGASAINDAGAVTGYADTLTTSHAFLWQNGSMTDLLAPPGFVTSYGLAINGTGVVAGFGQIAGGFDHAVLWDGSPVDLGTLPGDILSYATGINDAGQVVGGSFTGSAFRPFLYVEGEMLELSELVAPATDRTLVQANAINVLGQIAGNATDSGTTHGFLLSPPPNFQLRYLADAIVEMNAKRTEAMRTGTGYFLNQAIIQLDEGKPACDALELFGRDALLESEKGFLTAGERGGLTSAGEAVAETLGCP